MLGGLVGLGGAEFRLPLLVGTFGFGALEAIILNKAMSLVVVTAALPLRAVEVPLSQVLARADVILTLLSGSLAGAWVGAHSATSLPRAVLERTLAVLLAAMAGLLLLGHGAPEASAPVFAGTGRLVAGVAAGFGIGVVAAFMGVAGGELLIPTIVLLYGVDAALAGSLSLAVSLPTMLTGFARYSRDRSFAVLAAHGRFAAFMSVGSVAGAAMGASMLGRFPQRLLLPGLAAILLFSALRMWRHSRRPVPG